jgi:hypothetical protein
MARETYLTQLLPTAKEARYIRKALTDHLQDHDGELSDEERDIAWMYIAKISQHLVNRD